MKLLAPIAAFIAAVSAGQIYTNQPEESYAQSAEAYQSALEYQQQGIYSDQSQAYAPAAHGTPYQNRPLGEKTAKILSYISENDGHNYQFAYETENGIKAQEIGQTLGKGTEAQGVYSYTGDDGQVYTVSYIADEYGFRAQGNHLPTAPPIPEAIVKAMEQNAQDEAAGIYDDGSYRQQHHPAAQAYQQYDTTVYQPENGYQTTTGEAQASGNSAYHAHH